MNFAIAFGIWLVLGVLFVWLRTSGGDWLIDKCLGIKQILDKERFENGCQLYRYSAGGDGGLNEATRANPEAHDTRSARPGSTSAASAPEDNRARF